MPFHQDSPATSGTVLSPFSFDAETIGADEAGPSFGDLVGASFRTENEVGSLIASEVQDLSAVEARRVQDGYNPFTSGDLKGYEDHADKFLEAYNPRVVEAIKSDIDRETKDRETVEASGWGILTDVLAGVAAPSLLLPGGAMVRAGRVGYRTGRSALSIGLATGAGAAVQEGALQATQQTRDMGESALVVGGSVILGGLIGAAGSKLLTKSQFKRFARGLEEDLADEVPNPSEVSQEIIRRMQSAGAAAVDDIPLDDLEIGGPRAVKAIVAATNAVRLNPGLQLLTSKSSQARRVFIGLAENHVGTVGELEGRTAGAAVETAIKQWDRGALATFIGNLRGTFKEARRNGFTGSQAEFHEAVAKAARRNDIDPNGNPYVTEAAQALRSALVDPLKNEAISVGLLDANVKTVTAPSYLHRIWNAQRVISRESEFRSIVTAWARGVVKDAMMRQDEIRIARDISTADDLSDRLTGALDRAANVEKRLNERGEGRARRLDLIQKAQGDRFDVLRGRVPASVLEVAKSAKDGSAMLDAVREVSKAPPKQPKRPVIGILKQKGGVRIGSMLAQELENIGVNQRTAPGLFKREGGLTDADNLVASEEPLFAGMATDGNGYVYQDEIIAAIRDEMAGAPLRTDDELFENAARDAMEQNVEQWLNEIGLPPNATAKEVREYLNNALASEGRLSDLDRRISRMEGELNEFDSLTDGIRNEKLIADAEAKAFQDQLNELEAKINEVREFANASPGVQRLVDYADTRKAYAKGRYEQTRLGNRIEAIERVEADGRAAPEMLDELRALRADKNKADERVIKARAKIEKLKPMLPKDRGDELDFVSDLDEADYTNEIVDSIFDNITGRAAADAPSWIVPVTRGPLKGRTFNIPDELVEDFLENDAELVARRYARTMAAEVELTRRFGRADMRDQIKAIKDEYTALRAATADEAERAKLTAEEARDVEQLSAFRDMIRGTYRKGEEASAWSSATRLALSWNFITKLGGVTISSLPDLFGVMTKQGLRSFLDDGVQAMMATGTDALRIAKRDAREMGAITETVLQSRLAELAELNDPYAAGNLPERIMRNVTSRFSKLTFLDRWNDFNKTIVSLQTTNRIARLLVDNLVEVPRAGGKQVSYEAMSKWDRGYLGKLGIDEAMGTRMADQILKYGLKEQGIWGLNVTKWADVDARRAFAAALNKEVDGTVITPGIADKPLWARSNLGKLVMQFKSFGLAAHQRLLLSRLQGRPRYLAEFALFGTLAGMMISYLKLIERWDFEGAERLTQNPGLWVADGFDRTGIASVLMDVSNTAEKVGAPFGVRTAAQMLAGDEDRSADVSRYASRNSVGALLGPSVGLLQDAATIAAAVSNAEFNNQAARSVLRNIPGGTLPGARTAIEAAIKPAVTGE
jgi:hypothetical protein